MKIFFYWSPLCPRCHMARKSLRKLVQAYENIEIEEIDMVTQFKQASADGIRLFPAIRINDKKLAGIVLSSEKIDTFLNRNLQGPH